MTTPPAPRAIIIAQIRQIVRYIVQSTIGAIRARFTRQRLPMTLGVNRRAHLHPKYADIVEHMRARFDLRIRRWRKSMSGCAWRVYHHDGSVHNFIESPIPKTPISLAIFLHEVGHHAIGFGTYRQRCVEEYQAWMWSMAAMRKFGVEPDARVRRRFERSMQYAVSKAMRRGLKMLPIELVEFLPQAA